jgi:hypothetical protein
MMPSSLCCQVREAVMAIVWFVHAIEMYGYPALPIGRFRTCPQVGRRGVI